LGFFLGNAISINAFSGVSIWSGGGYVLEIFISPALGVTKIVQSNINCWMDT
jgi:hypothetical protein